MHRLVIVDGDDPPNVTDIDGLYVFAVRDADSAQFMGQEGLSDAPGKRKVAKLHNQEGRLVIEVL